MSLIIEKVENKKQLRDFIKVAWTVYKDEPNWVPWLYFERLEFFDREKNPFFKHGEADYFIARRDGRAVGTIAAIVNHRHNEFHEENSAHFGVFELLNDPAAGQALLETAEEWARQRGKDKILGPASFSSNDEWGLMIEGFERPPVVLTPYNPPYYRDIIEAAGFTKAMDLYAWNNHTVERMKPGGLPEKLIRVIGKVKQRYGLNIRNISMKHWDDDVETLKRIYQSAWEKNWGFVPFTNEEIDHLAANLKPLVDPRLIFFVEKDGQPVGMAISLPDVNEILHKIRPGPSVIGSYIAAARMILNKRKPNRIRVWALGVLEEYRGKGVDGLLYYETAKAAAPNGYEWAEASWILENNDAMNQPIQLLGSEIYKRYRVYEKTL